MSPVSNAPLLAVKVCVVPSLFFTVTLDPAFTVSVFGENARFLMVTDGLLARGVDAPAGTPVTTPLTTPRPRASSVVAPSAAKRDARDRFDGVGMHSSMPQFHDLRPL